jgi:hypothetical protein
MVVVPSSNWFGTKQWQWQGFSGPNLLTPIHGQVLTSASAQPKCLMMIAAPKEQTGSRYHHSVFHLRGLHSWFALRDICPSGNVPSAL